MVGRKIVEVVEFRKALENNCSKKLQQLIQERMNEGWTFRGSIITQVFSSSEVINQFVFVRKGEPQGYR